MYQRGTSARGLSHLGAMVPGMGNPKDEALAEIERRSRAMTESMRTSRWRAQPDDAVQERDETGDRLEDGQHAN